MKVFLAGPCSHRKPLDRLAARGVYIPYVLESFFSVQQWEMEYIKNSKMFLLDSGAFSFMTRSNLRVDFDEYLKKYIHFINKYNVKYFFELDIDSVVGLKKVEEYREVLERETGKKCIPVWHKSRGKQYFLDMVKEYDYVAIGGIASGEIKRREYKYFPWFIEQAHKHNCKIHGLGFTSTRLLKKYKFDSVDSTSWVYGHKLGKIMRFNANAGQIETVINSEGNKRLKSGLLANEHNLKEWLKYVRYMDGR